MGKARKLILWTGIVGFLICFVTAISLMVDGLRNETEPVDLGIILGNKVELNGKPSSRLKARLDHGVTLFSSGEVKLLMVSGGIGKEGYDEAVVMQQYLVSQGVPEANIRVDSHGVDTRHTAKHARALMTKEGLESAKAISQWFHISRCKLALKQADIETVSGSAPKYFEELDLFALPREVLGWWAYFLRLK